MTTKQLGKFFSLAEDLGLTPEAFQRALENGKVAEHLNEWVVFNDKLVELIALGKYDRVHEKIVTKYFPVAKIPTLGQMKLCHFDCNISSKDAKARMDRDFFRPATMAEGLVYASSNPEKQLEFPILLLGSVAQIGSDRYVGMLCQKSGKRHLEIDKFDGGWGRHCRFLALHK